jgi:hypothetical protein
MGVPCAVGRIGPDVAWVGFEADGPDYRLAVGDGVRTVLQLAEPQTLLALAIAYFEEALDDGPAELQATHADVAELVRHVAGGEADPGRRRMLDEAVDAIDDGLAADAVVSRLVAAWQQVPNEQADPVDLLVTRALAALAA